MNNIDLTKISDEDLQEEIQKRKNAEIKLSKGDPIWCWQNYENSKKGRIASFYKFNITDDKILCNKHYIKDGCLDTRDGSWKYNPNYGWIKSPLGPWYNSYDYYR